jgi:hypothetical protein
MKINAISLTLAALLGGFLMPAKTTAPAPASFQLVYHSDTRGFYNPCG